MDILRTYVSPTRIGGPAGLRGTSARPATATATPASLMSLCALYAGWKLLLVVVAAAAPGPGYDTSTQVWFDNYLPPSIRASSGESIIVKLTRWDAIYFATSSERGHVLEQEWAFSPYLASITRSIAGVLPSTLLVSAIARHALVGIVLSHVAHLAAAIVLYHLTYQVLPLGHARRCEVAFTAACLHVISPAALFLSASYGESFFALNNFLGMLFYSKATASRTDGGTSISWVAALYMVLSGIWFGQAAMVRSNGLLSGVIFAWDALLYIPKVLGIVRDRAVHHVVHLGAIVLGGSLIALAYALPQLQAYLEYCTDGAARPWCTRFPPSIYTWVQGHYWNVGFLRYWTLSNLPLFALAIPMLAVLVASSFVALQRDELLSTIDAISGGITPESRHARTTDGDVEHFIQCMARFAVPQLILAVLTATTFHVQIINRLSSGYPVWYMVLALVLHSKPASHVGHGALFARTLQAYSGWITRLMVMYAIVQGGLYASFLPPA